MLKSKSLLPTGGNKAADAVILEWIIHKKTPIRILCERCVVRWRERDMSGDCECCVGTQKMPIPFSELVVEDAD
jgi:hypothetical protein